MATYTGPGQVSSDLEKVFKAAFESGIRQGKFSQRFLFEQNHYKWSGVNLLNGVVKRTHRGNYRCQHHSGASVQKWWEEVTKPHHGRWVCEESWRHGDLGSPRGTPSTWIHEVVGMPSWRERWCDGEPASRVASLEICMKTFLNEKKTSVKYVQQWWSYAHYGYSSECNLLLNRVCVDESWLLNCPKIHVMRQRN